MNLGTFRKYINYLGSKENRGNTIPPEEFRDILQVAMIEYLTAEYKFFETDQKSTDSLGCIRKKMGGIGSPMQVTKGLAALPSDYNRAVSCGYIATKKIRGTEVSQFVEIDILSDAEFTSRKNSYIIKSNTYPFCKIVRNKKVSSDFPNGYIEFSEKDMVGVEFTYLTEVPGAYYDYCIGVTTLEEVYMPVGSRIVVAGAINNLVQGSTILYSNVYHVDNPVIPYTSRSVEMVFPEDQQVQIARHMLRQMGVNLKDEQLFQAVEYLKQEENAGR